MNPDIEIALFRVVQEALTNCMKHAEAKTVHLNLIEKEGVYLLSIDDNGKGFDYQAVSDLGDRGKGPLGITIMRERVVQIGGDFWIESCPGKGTVISVKIPVL